jgi:hypothetical protein
MHVFSFTVMLVEFVSCSRVWQFFMCSFAASNTFCLGGHHIVYEYSYNEEKIFCILESCYIRLTLNICSFVRQCNTFTVNVNVLH